MDDQCKYNTYICYIYNQLQFIDHPTKTLSYSIFHNLKSIQICSQIQFSYAIQFSYTIQFNSILPINSVMPLMNLTYVIDIQDIRVIGTVPLGCRSVSNGFITQYGPAGLLTGYNNRIVNITDTVLLGC